MTQSNNLNDFYETRHYSRELMDPELLEEVNKEDEVDPDDDEDYEPELTPEMKLALMSNEEFEEFVTAHLKSKRNNGN